jgi:alkyl sulfatase BDS1-like metallo-beta-lactamase superfamily hydrolase
MRRPPPQSEALASLRRTLGSTSDTAINRAAGLLLAIPDERLERLMRSPARKPVIETIFFLMPRYLDRTRARGLNLAIRWRVTSAAEPDADPDVYDLVIAERRCRVVRTGRGPAPLVTITIEATDLLRVATGRTNPMQAYFDGRLKLRGDIMQAARLTSLFQIPNTPRTKAP